jgi:hypothetical protein
LYIGLVVSSLLYALKAALQLPDKADVNLAYTWFAVLVLLLIGGITKQDQYDKLLWFAFGACTSMAHFYGAALGEKQASAVLNGSVEQAPA